MSLTVPVSVFLLNDLSQLPATAGYQKIPLYAGLTAAKKLVAMRWKQPDKLSVTCWLLTFLDVVYMELSTARVIGVKESNIGGSAEN